MSRYLIHRIKHIPNIHLETEVEIAEFAGEPGDLRGVTVKSTGHGDPRFIDCQNIFSMIGAAPNTSWLGEQVARDPKGFIKTGRGLDDGELTASLWLNRERPTFYETSLPGVYAVGDVRADSTKRVASAVGEGSVVVQFVHKLLSLV